MVTLQTGRGRNPPPFLFFPSKRKSENKELLDEANAEWNILFNEETPKKQIKTKKEFIADNKAEVSDLRQMRRKLERQSFVTHQDEHDYHFQSNRFLGEIEGVFKFMGWGTPPKSLTKNIEAVF